MNLSQDEINALLTVNPQDDTPADDGSADVLSPEAIDAMLNATPAADGPDDTDAVDIMSPEAIAAMLGDAPAADGGNETETADIMSPEAIAAMLGGEEGAQAADAANDDFEAMLARNDEAASETPLTQNGPISKEGMLTAEEIDVLGEVGNISMGAVATTMYSLLDRRVSITTPRVSVYDAKDVLTIYRIPFVVATIEYVEGITGTNLLVLKVEDAALITDLLMGGDGKIEGPIELNEMHLSAMSEIMNQMMGASSTSLSKLLRTQINISPPKSTQVDVGFNVAGLLGDEDMVTKVSFDMEIEGLLKSELIQLIPYEASRGFAKRFMDAGFGMSSGDGEETAAPRPAASSPAPAPAPAQQAAPAPPPAITEPPPSPVPAQQQQAEQYPPPAYQQPQYPQPPYQQAPYPAAQYPPPAYQQDPYQQGPYPPPAYPQGPYPQPGMAQGRLVDVHPMQFQAFDSPGPVGEQKGMDLVYNIPLQVTVELGKTKKEISEILEFGTGTIVVLDKIAGDPVEIVVNGKLIARGEVVVIDENYGVRITDIING